MPIKVARESVTFRRRLILFFVLIVVLPMVAVALLVTQVADEWRTGKADARLDASMETALSLFDRSLAAAAADARIAGRDDAVAGALRRRDSVAAQEAATRLRRELDLASLTIETPSGRTVGSGGSPDAFAASAVVVRDPDGTLGRVQAAELRADEYTARVQNLTGREVAVFRGERRLGSTVELGDAQLPEEEGTSDVELPAGHLRVSTVAPDRGDPTLRLAIFGSAGGKGFLGASPEVVLAVAAFFAVALLCVVLLVTALQGQVREMFAAARRVGGGDFSQKVPVEGNDEMAGLAREFNTMSERLAEQMAELRGQRAELDRSVKRIGEAFAAGLDRTALLEIVAETALAACAATSARVLLPRPRGLEAEAGERPTEALGDALRAAEEQALRDGVGAEASRGDARAVAEPLGALGAEQGRRAVLAIGRVGAPFDSAQREMLRYLAGQAAVSVENIELHELISQGAITDELTGLSNRRRFDDLIDGELERASRFGKELSVVLVKVDEFKRVIDSDGRAQGDEVLRELARILQGASRGVDEVARYGDEEFVAALPEAGTEGALAFAERVRSTVGEARIPVAAGSGALRFTVSAGIATATESRGDARDLIATARAALDRASAAGGDRIEVAHPGPRPQPSGERSRASRPIREAWRSRAG
jgi:diguanylate cyclase (GGDEF)-like protein